MPDYEGATSPAPNNTIADNLQRLITAKTDIKNAIITMGGGLKNPMV